MCTWKSKHSDAVKTQSILLRDGDMVKLISRNGTVHYGINIGKFPEIYLGCTDVTVVKIYTV